MNKILAPPLAANYMQKKRTMPQTSYPSKRQVIGSSSRAIVKKSVPIGQGSQNPSCTKCGRYHFGEFAGRDSSLLPMWQAGNCIITTIVVQRPHGGSYEPRQPGQARVYSLTPNSANIEESNAVVVTSTILLFGSFVCNFLIKLPHIHSSHQHM